MNKKATMTLAVLLIMGGIFSAVQMFGVSGMDDQRETALKMVVTPDIESQVESGTLMQATFGAGCFWGVEDRFSQVPGVVATEVGYTGGNVADPNYRLVCSGTTGHAEAVRVVYNPNETNYEKLLDAFFKMHNPTTPNRQGWDVGAQYRSAIFYYSSEQEAAAKKKIQQLEQRGAFSHPIVTQVVQAGEFWRAEEYHQKYHVKNGGFCKL